MTARVRDIDPVCRYALVSHWRKPLRLFDLRALRWVPHFAWERRLYLWTRSAPPRLRARGELIWPDVTAMSGDVLFYGMYAREIESGQQRKLARVDGDTPGHGTAVSATGDLFYYVSDSQRVIVLPPDGAAASYEPLPRKVLQAVHIDAERGLLVSASWNELALHHFEAGALSRLGHTATTRQADVRFVGVGGSRVVAVTASWNETFVEVYELDRDDSLLRGATGIAFAGPFQVGALSRDGRYFAAASSGQLVVCDLDAGTRQLFNDHSDAINAVRFSADDHVLVSADTDHRIVLRPRTPAGYAAPLLTVEVNT
jgi:sugar lactone lactonase YvrE